MSIYVVATVALSMMVGGTSLAAGAITESTHVALTLFVSGVGGVGWLVWMFANWKRDLEEEMRELRREAGLPPKSRKGRKQSGE